MSTLIVSSTASPTQIPTKLGIAKTAVCVLAAVVLAPFYGIAMLLLVGTLVPAAFLALPLLLMGYWPSPAPRPEPPPPVVAAPVPQPVRA
jgi:hypothetical protein